MWDGRCLMSGRTERFGQRQVAPAEHGNTVLTGGMRADVVSLLPATMLTADMQPDDVGTWLFHCHVNDHIAAGMLSLYTVTP